MTVTDFYVYTVLGCSGTPEGLSLDTLFKKTCLLGFLWQEREIPMDKVSHPCLLEQNTELQNCPTHSLKRSFFFFLNEKGSLT